MTHCPLASGEENVDILLDYCNRKLDPALVDVFEQHMQVCAACRAFAESQMAVWDALDAFEALPVSPDFDRKLMARIEREESSPFRNLWNRLTAGGTALWRPLIPVAAALVLAVGLWMRPASNSGLEVAPIVAETQFDAEQVETALQDMEMLRQLALTEPATQQKM
ncbi:MAG: hypothetical protein JNK48_07770 [Bryobacterales bacterium]|nr:hypothetical protein [Bryobacterales bacterium]